MGVDSTVKIVEEYARSYIQYILAFFSEFGPADEGGDPPPAQPVNLADGSLLIFGLFNALIGAALQGLFMQRLKFNDINFPQAVIIEVCYWLFLAILMHFMLNFRNKKSHFSSTLTVILKVVPVAYMIGAYFAFVAYFVTLAFAPGWVAPWVAAAAFAGAEILLLALFLPRFAAREIVGPSKGRRYFATGGVVALVAAIQFTVLTVTIPGGPT